MLQISSANLSPGCTGRGRPLRAKRRRHLPRWFSWLTVVRLVFRIVLTIWELDRLWKLNRPCESLIVTLVWCRLWINAWFANSDAALKSWLHEVPPTFQWAVSVISMIWMGIISIPLTGWASILGALCIRIPAATPDTGVLDVVTSPASFAGDALDLLVR